MDAQKFKNLLFLLEEGDYILSLEKIIPPHSIEEQRAYYFFMRDLVAEETGNSKKDIHAEAKNLFLEGGSTSVLNEEEWRVYIKKFKEWAFEHFNVYL